MSDHIDKVNEFANERLPEEYRAPALKVVDGDAPSFGRIDLGRQISQIAREVGLVLKDVNFFYFGEGYVTVDESTGEIEAINPIVFCTWVEEYLVFFRWKSTGDGQGEEHVVSIAKELAGRILESRQLRGFVRPLKAVNEARMPVLRNGAVELLPVGYDPDTCVYTAPVIDYDTSWSLEQARGFFAEVYREFPWFEQTGAIFEKRSFVAQLAATLGPYCRMMLPEGYSKPMVVWQGNQPGCGKSLLMRMALAPVYGACAESSKPKSEADLEKLLDAAAITRKPYLILDDVKFLASSQLNQFITSPVLAPRILGQSKMITCPNVCQVFSTGNQLKLTYDLERRSLVVDLFDPGRSIDRDVKNPITAAWLWTKETRAKFLAALYAFVREWCELGRPSYDQSVKKSFEPFSQLVGSICIAGGCVNPFGARENTEGGDTAGRALEMLLAVLVGELNMPTVSYTARAIAEQAESRGYVDSIFPYAVKDVAKSIGQKLSPLKGRRFKDSRGRLFEFGKRRVEAGSLYEVTLIDQSLDEEPSGSAVLDGLHRLGEAEHERRYT